jgi:hypothetical protein
MVNIICCRWATASAISMCLPDNESNDQRNKLSSSC